MYKQLRSRYTLWFPKCFIYSSPSARSSPMKSDLIICVCVRASMCTECRVRFSLLQIFDAFVIKPKWMKNDIVCFP